MEEQGGGVDDGVPHHLDADENAGFRTHIYGIRMGIDYS